MDFRMVCRFWSFLLCSVCSFAVLLLPSVSKRKKKRLYFRVQLWEMLSNWCKWRFCEAVHVCGPSVTRLSLTFPKSSVLPQAVPELVRGPGVHDGKKAPLFLMQNGRISPLGAKRGASPLCLLKYPLWHWSLCFSCSRKMAKAEARGGGPWRLWSKAGPVTWV